MARAAGNIVLWMGMTTSTGQYPPVFLSGKPPPCMDILKTFIACGSSAPMRVENEGGTSAWVEGTLVAPSVRAHGLPLPQELWPDQDLFSSLL